jgi:protein SCO1/2
MILFLLAALTILGYQIFKPYQFHGSILQEPIRAAEIVLRADTGPVRLSDFRGKIILLYFGYMSCPDVCPTSMANIKHALCGLPSEEAAQVQVIFISVDPGRDTFENLGKYVRVFGANFIGATGTREEIDLIPAPSGHITKYTHRNPVVTTRWIIPPLHY